MGLADKVGRRLVAFGKALIAEERAPATGPQPDLEVRRVGDFEVRACRKGDRIDVDARLDGQVVVHERHALGADVKLSETLDRFAAKVRGTERAARAQLRERATSVLDAAVQCADTVKEAERRIVEATKLRDGARAELPAAEWAAERAREWFARVEKKQRSLEDVALAKLQSRFDLSADALRSSPFPAAWLVAAQENSATFSGSVGPGRTDVARIVVARTPADGLLHHLAGSSGGEVVHYICVPATEADGASKRVLSDAQAAFLAWEMRAVADGVGAGVPPVVTPVVAREMDRGFAEEVARIVAAAGLRADGWELQRPPALQSVGGPSSGPEAPPPSAPAPAKAEQSVSGRPGSGPEAPPPPARAPAKAEQEGKAVFRVGKPLFAHDLTARVIGNLAFGEAFVRNAVEGLKDGKTVGPIVGEVGGTQVKRIVFADRGADAMAYHQIAGERAGSVFIAANGTPLTSVVAMDVVKKVLSAPDVAIEAAFAAGKDGGDRTNELRDALRDALAGRRVVRCEPTHGQFWLNTVEAKAKAQGKSR
jgi:hypothetical protein